jgi:hypothetical protein
MKVENLFHIISFIFLIASGCKSPGQSENNSTLLTIKLSQDSSAVELHGIPSEVLAEFKSDSLSEKEWRSFFAIYKVPADPELRDIERPVKGDYVINDSIVNFTPTEPFHKKQSYFVQCYARKLFVEPEDIVKSRKLPSRSSVQEVTFDF